MGVIYLRRFDESGGSGYISYWYQIPIFDDLSIDYNSPASPMPLPEEDDESQVVVKIEGNSSTITISWLIKEESSNMGAANTTQGFTWGADIQKVWEQVSYLQTKFVPKSVSDSFEFCIDADSDITNVFSQNAPFDFKKAGTITKVSFRVPSNEPATIRASITFMVGDVVTAYALDTPSSPKDYAVASGAAGRLDASWTAPRTTNGSVTYTVFYREVGTSAWLDEPDISSTSVQITLGSSANGKTYEAYVRAKNSNGYGERSPTFTQVIAS